MHRCYEEITFWVSRSHPDSERTGIAQSEPLAVALNKQLELVFNITENILIF